MTMALTTFDDGGYALNEPKAQRVLLSLHRALDFAELWQSLQRLLETVVPHDTLVMSVNYLDWRREASTRRLYSERSRVSHDDDLNQLVATEGRMFFQPFLEKNKGIHCYRHSQVMADVEKIPETNYYQRYMIPLGWRYSAHMLFWREGGVETSFALRRRADQGDFSDAEMSALEALHPQIAVAFERVRVFEAERRRRRLLENFYRAKPEAVLFLDWELNVLYASQEAIALCAIWNLGRERARLYTAQAVFMLPETIKVACEAMKSPWLEQLQPGSEVEPRPLDTHLASPQGVSQAVITLRRETGGALTKPLFVVRLSDVAQLTAGVDDSAHGRLLGGLTLAERALADLVCEGLSNKEIAIRLKRSEGSIKVQLSGIFQKLRVNSRAKLMVALRS